MNQVAEIALYRSFLGGIGQRRRGVLLLHQAVEAILSGHGGIVIRADDFQRLLRGRLIAILGGDHRFLPGLMQARKSRLLRAAQRSSFAERLRLGRRRDGGGGGRVIIQRRELPGRTRARACQDFSSA